MQSGTPGPAGFGGSPKAVNGGRFDFDDGGTYCGGWEDGKAHGHGVCTGPKGQGEYSGSWHFGFEVSGVYTWPSGSTFEGQWQNGKRHGLGTEYRGRWTYRGEWTQGFKGRYGVRQATASSAKYEGTWANGLQDGYGSETYADGGTFQGQWLRGLRHGYGVRTSAPFGMASHFRPKAPHGSMASLKSESAGEPTAERDRRIDDVRGGFVLKARSDEPPARRRSLVERSSNIKESILKGLKLRKQRSTGDLDKRGTSSSIRSTASSSSWMSSDSAVTSGSHHTDSNASFVVEDEQMDANVTETYMGEWKNDKRGGFGISERSDGLKYEGEWYGNKKYGYGVTTFKDGTKEEGKYKNNVLITSQKKKHLFLIRSAKFRERIDAAVNAAQRASKIALQKADIAISRTATARGKGEQADIAAAHAREDSELARLMAKQFAPDFQQPGTESVKPPPPANRPPNNPPDLNPRRPEPRVPSRRHEPSPPIPSPYPESLSFDPATFSLNERTSSENYLSYEVPPQQLLVPELPPDRGRESIRRNPYQPPFHSSSQMSFQAHQPPPHPHLSHHPSQLHHHNNNNSSSQPTNDHFDHYKRPPSRDSSVDRFGGGRARSRTRGATPEVGSRATSRQRTPFEGRGRESGSTAALDALLAEAEDKVPSRPGSRRETPAREESLGPTSLYTPKRTESLFLKPNGQGPVVGGSKVSECGQGTLGPEPRMCLGSRGSERNLQVCGGGGAGGGKRKKSLPDATALPTATTAMTREEVATLGSARRHEVRRMAEEADRLRANPLLHLLNPNLQNWLSRQKLVMFVLLVNLSLAIMFLQLLT